MGYNLTAERTLQSSRFGPQHKRESGAGGEGKGGKGKGEGGREKGAIFLNTFFFSLQKKNSICCSFNNQCDFRISGARDQSAPLNQASSEILCENHTQKKAGRKLAEWPDFSEKPRLKLQARFARDNPVL